MSIERTWAVAGNSIKLSKLSWNERHLGVPWPGNERAELGRKRLKTHVINSRIKELKAPWGW